MTPLRSIKSYRCLRSMQITDITQIKRTKSSSQLPICYGREAENHVLDVNTSRNNPKDPNFRHSNELKVSLIGYKFPCRAADFLLSKQKYDKLSFFGVNIPDFASGLCESRDTLCNSEPKSLQIYQRHMSKDGKQQIPPFRSNFYREHISFGFVIRRFLSSVMQLR